MSDEYKFNVGDRVAVVVSEDSAFFESTGTVSEVGDVPEWDFFVSIDDQIPAPSGFEYKDNIFGFNAYELELLA